MPRGPRPMGFVIQAAAGKTEACPRTGRSRVLGQADNAACGRLGAKSAGVGARGMS